MPLQILDTIQQVLLPHIESHPEAPLMGASHRALETTDILQLPNIQYPPAKVLYGGQVQQGMSNDEVFLWLPLSVWISWKVLNLYFTGVCEAL